jgi:hypothetical protein
MLIGLVLAGCDHSPSGDAPAAPSPPAPSETPPPPAEPLPAPSGEVPPADAPEVAPAPATSPAPEISPPAEPSAVPKPTSTEPAVESMHVAEAGAKTSVPVTLRYQVENVPGSSQAYTVHLAAVPRVAGARLEVSVKKVTGLQIASGPLQVEKVSAATPYRQRLSITRTSPAPENLRVLVTMEQGGSLVFGYFTVPLATGNTTQKQDSVKQR